jgi:predicted Holliday junction resolvase-like endonuclease
MTVYLDPRGPAQEEAEELQKQIEEQEKQENVQKVMDVINGLFAYTVILPLLFMFAFNFSLTKMFGFDKIGYVESLGVVIVARVLRGKK